MRIWTAEQIRAFLKVAQADWYYALYVLAFATGMRKGELLALRWEDVDLEAGALSVRQTLVHMNKAWHLFEPKTDSGRRRLELARDAVDALRLQRARLFTEGLRASEWCFPSKAGTPTNTQNLVRYSFEKLIAAAGLARIVFHAIRHSAASLWLAAGEHPKIVQERLGHASIGITMDTYSHVLPSAHKAAAERIGELLR